MQNATAKSNSGSITNTTVSPGHHASKAGEVRPWWKEFYVWMVIAGPVSVVLACAVTGVYIMRGPDALVSEDYYREGIEISKQLKNASPPMEPAQTGRNHSATGGKNTAGKS